MKGIFLDISNTFDKVWHSGLFFRLQGYGFEGKLLALLKGYPDNRKQRVLLSDLKYCKGEC